MADLTVQDKHTPEMIAHEIKLILGVKSGVFITLGQLETLYVIQSPYLFDVEKTDADIEAAAGLIGVDGGTTEERDSAIKEAVSAVMRLYETIKPPENAIPDDSRNGNPVFSPEWLTDTISGAMQAVPSMTIKEALWDLPAVSVIHFSLSTFRRMGGRTERPSNDEEAVKQYLEMLKCQKQK